MAPSPVSHVVRKQPPLTHFLCLPLVTQTSKVQLKDSLNKFREDVLVRRRESSDRDGINSIPNSWGPTGGNSGNSVAFRILQVSEGASRTGAIRIESDIPPKAIRPLGSLHLTLGVMSLTTPTDIQRALEVLQGLNLTELLKNSLSSSNSNANTLTPNTPLNISLESLTSMHPPPKTSILYANPTDPSGRLLPFCQSVLNALKEVPKANGESLMVADTRPLFLHATIVNTIYAKGARGSKSGPSRGKSQGKISFDATSLLEEYRDYVWMRDVRIEKVAICRMGAKKLVDEEGRETGDEEYVVEGEVDMP